MRQLYIFVILRLPTITHLLISHQLRWTKTKLSWRKSIDLGKKSRQLTFLAGLHRGPRAPPSKKSQFSIPQPASNIRKKRSQIKGDRDELLMGNPNNLQSLFLIINTSPAIATLLTSTQKEAEGRLTSKKICLECCSRQKSYLAIYDPELLPPSPKNTFIVLQ